MTKPPRQIVEHSKELDFTIVCSLTYPTAVTFRVYDIEGWQDDDTPLWHKKDSPSHPDPVETLDEAEVFLHGDVKWDGCSNWYFDTQDQCMIHGCSRKDITRIGKVLGRCWDIARREMPDNQMADESDADDKLPAPDPNDPLFKGFSDTAPPPPAPEWTKALHDDFWVYEPDSRGRWVATAEDRGAIISVREEYEPGSFYIQALGPTEEGNLELYAPDIRSGIATVIQLASERADAAPEDTAYLWQETADFAHALLESLDATATQPYP